MLLNHVGMVFVGKRIDNVTEAWQMPQGGIDEGEDAITACMRELGEETGTQKAELIAEHPDWLNYDIPQPLSDRLWQGTYRGQKQKWMLLRFTGTDADINIQTEEPEFIEWRWAAPDQLIDLAVPFKRDVYASVLSVFSPLI
jgi:putative (di)nucleoside polyphosphate hydrolase